MPVTLPSPASGMGAILTYMANPGRAANVARRIGAQGGQAVALPLDVADCASFPAFRSAIEATLGSTWGRAEFDYLVNNAGYGRYNPIEAVTEAEFDGLYNVHLKDPFFLTQTPLMATDGHVVNIVSATSRVAMAGVAPYARFKAGLEVLTRSQAKEFGPRRIRTDAIVPGPIHTELGGGLSAAFETMLAGQTVLGRIGEADEVGSIIAGLLSEPDRGINAQTIEVGECPGA